MDISFNRNIHRLNADMLLKIGQNVINSFALIREEINLTNNQYVHKSEKTSYNPVDNIVWNSGDFQHRINKTYAMLDPLYTPKESDYVAQTGTVCSLCLGRSMDWTAYNGILLVIVDTVTQEYLFSSFIRFESFVPQNTELIDGVFWSENYTFAIPASNNILSYGVVYVDAVDVENGLISNYPTEFVPLIDEKPLPDTLQVGLTLTQNHFITIQLINTDPQKTIEQTILDYFNTEVADIQLVHKVTYGIRDLMYRSIGVFNNDNIFDSVSVGLDMLPFVDFDRGNNPIHIYVETEISVGGKIIKRETELNVDALNVISPVIWSQISKNKINYPVTVEEITEIKQTVIEKTDNQKLVPIPQIQIANKIDSSVYDILLPLAVKVFYHDNIVPDSIMVISYENGVEMTTIRPKLDVVSRPYFDLTMLLPLVLEASVKQWTYKVYTGSSVIIEGVIRNKAE